MPHKLSSFCHLVWVATVVFSTPFSTAEKDKSTVTKVPKVSAPYWAYQAPQRPAVPKVPGNTSANPIDAFIAEQLRSQSITPNAAANPRQLIRRLSYDLTGLPPTAAQYQSFLKKTSNAEIPAADWSQTVSEFLTSPHYGEKLASLWLDTVRYAETNGYERDSVKPNIWRYRDYVIDSFNQDLPYNQFLTEQLAGDEIPNATFRSNVATGYLALMLRDDEPADPEQAHADMISDIADVTGEAILGTTMNCAKCHDHKGDPILQSDYFALRAFFEPIKSAKLKTSHHHWQDPAQLAQWKKDQQDTQSQINQLWSSVDPTRLSALSPPSSTPPAEPVSPVIPLSGNKNREAWQLSYTQPKKLNWDLPSYQGDAFKVVALPMHHGKKSAPYTGDSTPWDPKNNTLYLRKDFRLESIPDRLIVYSIGNTESWTVSINGVQLYQGPAQKAGSHHIYPLSKADLGNLTTGKNTLTIVVRSPKRQLKHFNAGVYQNLIEPISPQLYARLFPEHIKATYGKAFYNQYLSLSQKFNTTRQSLAAKGTPYLKHDEIKNSPKSHIHGRGSVHALGDEVFPGIPIVMATSPDAARLAIKGDYQKTGTHGRRLALARWIASQENPLTARVMVNRLWQHCFGTGIVATANDFGKFGEGVSNQALLDWLACEFMESGWSIKHMLQLMLTSETYRRSSAPNQATAKTDPLNHLHWKHSSRRLTAEEIRDTFLNLSSELRLQKPSQPYIRPPMPAAVLATSSKPKQVWPATKGPEVNCRSVYIHVKRSIQLPLLSAFDAPARDTSCPSRFATTVPTQTLSMLNSKFVNDRAALFAANLEKQHSNDVAKQLVSGFQLATGRPPTEGELSELTTLRQDLLTTHQLPPSSALARICLLFLNLNETLYLD